MNDKYLTHISFILNREQISPFGPRILGLVFLSTPGEMSEHLGFNLSVSQTLLISPHSVPYSRRPSLGVGVEAIPSLTDHAPE